MFYLFYRGKYLVGSFGITTLFFCSAFFVYYLKDPLAPFFSFKISMVATNVNFSFLKFFFNCMSISQTHPFIIGTLTGSPCMILLAPWLRDIAGKDR